VGGVLWVIHDLLLHPGSGTEIRSRAGFLLPPTRPPLHSDPSGGVSLSRTPVPSPFWTLGWHAQVAV